MSNNTLFTERYQYVGSVPPMNLKDNLVRLRTSKGWSQAELARRIGVRQNTIAAIETGATTRTKYLSDLARALDVSVEELSPPDEPAKGFMPVSAPLGAVRDFPIYSSAEGGPGELIRSSDPVDWVPRPEPVARVKGAYGLYIVGESMVPEFEPGDVALVNPVLPILGNTTCILYAEREGEARATVKRVLRSTQDKWFLRQWNPPKDFSLNRKEWGICHRALGKYYRP